MQVNCQSNHPITDTTETSSFFMHQFNNSSLAVFTYYVESDGEAIIIDPLRDVDPYLAILNERKAKLKYIYETHFHADFVSGHLELAHKTGATIVFGPTATTKYKSYISQDEEIINLGKIQIKTLHTPGHTLESSCFLLISEGKPFCLFTGDTLFMGDVGRPDLAVSSDLKETDLAGMLFNSLETKIKTLSDDIWIYPAHGAGSACGKNIGTGYKCTIGLQKKNNYALQTMSKEEFVAKLTFNLPSPPKYFFYDASINKEGYELFENVFSKSYKPLQLEEVEKHIDNNESIIIDARDPINIMTGYIPSSLGVSLKCPFNSWVGKLVKPKTKIVLVCEKGAEGEAITQLGRIGYDSVEGFLDGGFDSWKGSSRPIKIIRQAKPQDITKVLEEKKTLLDVREPGEWEAGVVGDPIKISVTKLEERLNEIPKDQEIFCYCRSGIRGIMAVTTLQRNGFTNEIYNVVGGYDKIKESGIL